MALPMYPAPMTVTRMRCGGYQLIRMSHHPRAPWGPDEMMDDASARAANHVIAVGGGRGGVGKSLVSVNLAVYLAQLGKSVVLIDLDQGGSNLHAHFGLEAARSEPDLSDGGAAAI